MNTKVLHNLEGEAGQWAIRKRRTNTLVLRRVGSGIGAIRELIGLSNDQLADALNIPPPQMSQICTGKREMNERQKKSLCKLLKHLKRNELMSYVNASDDFSRADKKPVRRNRHEQNQR